MLIQLFLPEIAIGKAAVKGQRDIILFFLSFFLSPFFFYFFGHPGLYYSEPSTEVSLIALEKTNARSKKTQNLECARRRSDGIIIMWTVERVWCFTSTRVPRIWDYKTQIITDTWLYGGTSFLREDIHIAYYFPEKYIIIRIFIDFENQSLIK